MTYEEYERQNEMEDNYQDAVDCIVENMSFDDHADDCWFDFGDLANAYEAMTQDEHAKLKELSPRVLRGSAENARRLRGLLLHPSSESLE